MQRKVLLRKSILKRIKDPVVIETHGGYGEIYRHCYLQAASGLVTEKDEQKARFLAEQRPHWAVYNCEAERILSAGLDLSHYNLIDIDPYGQPWEIIDLIFTNQLPDEFWMVVNDGLRQKIRLGGAWNTDSLAEIVREFGNNLDARYLEVCRELITRKADGYTVSNFAGYYCGAGNQMTHYAVKLNKLS